MPKEPDGSSPENEAILGSGPGDWERKINEKGDEYFELIDSGQEKKELEPNYDHIAGVLAVFYKEQKEGKPNGRYAISPEVFEQDGFTNIHATWSEDYLSGVGYAGHIVLGVLPKNPDVWNAEDQKVARFQISRIATLLSKQKMNVGMDFGPDFPGTKVNDKTGEPRKPKFVDEDDEDDPFRNL